MHIFSAHIFRIHVGTFMGRCESPKWLPVSGCRRPFGAGLNGRVGHTGLGSNFEPSLKWPTAILKFVFKM